MMFGRSAAVFFAATVMQGAQINRMNNEILGMVSSFRELGGDECGGGGLTTALEQPSSSSKRLDRIFHKDHVCDRE